MKKVGMTLLVIGVIGLTYFGYNAMEQSESFEILGAEVAVTTADWTPVIGSGIVALIGIILLVMRKGK